MGQMAGDLDEVSAAAAEKATLWRKVALRPTIVYDWLSAIKPIFKAQILIFQEQYVVGGNRLLSPFQGLLEGVAAGEFGIEFGSKGHRLGIENGSGVAHSCTSQPILEQALSNGFHLGSSFASVKHNALWSTGNVLERIHNFVSFCIVGLTKLVFEKQSSLPGVAAEVENVGKNVLYFGAGRKSAAQSIQGGWG